MTEKKQLLNVVENLRAIAREYRCVRRAVQIWDIDENEKITDFRVERVREQRTIAVTSAEERKARFFDDLAANYGIPTDLCLPRAVFEYHVAHLRKTAHRVALYDADPHAPCATFACLLRSSGVHVSELANAP